MATTQWSLVLAARDGSDTEARRALEALCQTYWPPLYAYIRHRESDPEEARDLVQAYFAEFLEKKFLEQVDPEKGPFRSFLLSSLRHFLSHERERKRTSKRGGGASTLSLDIAAGEEEYALQPSAGRTPEEVYEQIWAMTVLNRAMDRLRRDYADSGRGAQFEELKRYLTSADLQVPYREVAKKLDSREQAVKTAVYRLRKRYGDFLRVEIAQTVSDPAEVESELRHLLAVVRPGEDPGV